LNEQWQLIGIDQSALGLIRRLAPWLLGARGKSAANIIPWEDIELITQQHTTENESEQALQVQRSSTGHLAEMHPADIVEIVHQLTPVQGARLIAGLDDEMAADTMEEIDTERQRHILEIIGADRAADILEAMGPDEAADLLGQLSEAHAQELLELMNPEESEDVQELLSYAAHTAGGLMTTDYIMLNTTKTVSEALAAIRRYRVEEDGHAAYVYCIEDETQDESRLLGVVSIWGLLISQPETRLQDLMETDLITVHPDADTQTVAQIMAKYNLLAVPVVSDDGVLEGVVTVDDALDMMLPTDKRSKPIRMY
ncbi:MAG: CBS domain-containing protein, partial [Chloroflexota bacterium]|nr:CBS domain-containing protein [Chloroflexota bacterium]